jgi:oxalate decarboxylase
MNGVQHFNLGTIEGATGLSKEIIGKIDQGKIESYMARF